MASPNRRSYLRRRPSISREDDGAAALPPVAADLDSDAARVWELCEAISPTESTATSVTVAVRCRPMNAREIAAETKSVVTITGQQIVIAMSEDGEAMSDRTKDTKAATTCQYAFDSCLDSSLATAPAAQQATFDALGVPILKHAWDGFNVGLLAYVERRCWCCYSDY